MELDATHDWTAEQRALVIGILTDVIAMAPELPGHRGQAARSAAHLLLSHSCPWLDAEARADLGRTCELAAARHR
jgi:hypothetical protein